MVMVCHFMLQSVATKVDKRRILDRKKLKVVSRVEVQHTGICTANEL
jgi:hypothetical protein